MFVGHYAPAAALRGASAALPLWHLFVAVQFLDYLWAAFILTGVEKARVVEGFLAASDLDLYSMPWTHSLVAAAVWSMVGAAAYRAAINPRAGWRGAMAIGAAIASHWVADLLVHARDLALYPGSPIKLGFGLWSSVALSQTLEIGLFVGGLLLYARWTKAKSAAGSVSLALLFVGPLAAQAYNLWGPSPSDITNAAISALAAYTAMAALAAFADRTRSPQTA